MISLLTLILCGLTTLAAGFDPGPGSDSEEAELRRSLDRHLEEEDWDRAASVARKLKIKGNRETRKEMEKVVFYIEGRRALEKLRRKKLAPRKAFPGLDRFIEKYGRDERLKTLAGTYRRELESLIYVTIDDFETTVRSDTFQPVTDPDRVREGKRAARWRPTGKDDAFIHTKERDWTPFTHLVFWAYTERPCRIVLQPMTDVHDNFDCPVSIPAGKWTEIRVPLRGKGSRFRSIGQADWSAIGALRLHRLRGTVIDVVLDHVRLERPES